MTDYEFGDSLYRNAREMCDAIADNWLSARGANDRSYMLDSLEQCTDEQLADEAITEWGLDQPTDDDRYRLGDDEQESTQTWMGQRDTTRDDLVTAFRALRRDFDKRFP